MKKILPVVLFMSLALLNCNKDEDPCEGITCQNGGECVNGTCKCEEGYEGPDCSKQVTPTKIRVTKIEVTKFPATKDNGGGWDVLPSSGPDIYPLVAVGNSVHWVNSVYFEDVTSTSFSITPSPTLELNPTTQYSIGLYDYDGIADPDFLGGVTFSVYDNTNGFPETLELAPVGGKVFLRLHLTYFF